MYKANEPPHSYALLDEEPAHDEKHFSASKQCGVLSGGTRLLTIHSMKCSSDRSCRWEAGAATNYKLQTQAANTAVFRSTQPSHPFTRKTNMFNPGCLQSNRNIVLSSDYRTPTYVITVPAPSLYT
ncbi:unnamed protein product [Ectocarpus sp. 8 AP-2014]